MAPGFDIAALYQVDRVPRPPVITAQIAAWFGAHIARIVPPAFPYYKISTLYGPGDLQNRDHIVKDFRRRVANHSLEDVSPWVYLFGVCIGCGGAPQLGVYELIAAGERAPRTGARFKALPLDTPLPHHPRVSPRDPLEWHVVCSICQILRCGLCGSPRDIRKDSINDHTPLTRGVCAECQALAFANLIPTHLTRVSLKALAQQLPTRQHRRPR